MKILVNRNQYKKLINEISLLDVIKQADESDILSLEIPDTTNSLNLKLTRQAMENVLKRGVSELEKYIESPEEYIKSLTIEEIPQETPQPPEEPPTPPEKVESPQIRQKIKELETSQEYLDELTSKKGYKSVRDRNNIDLLRINIARLNRDLNKLRDISESKKIIKRLLKEQAIDAKMPTDKQLQSIRIVLKQMKTLPKDVVENYQSNTHQFGSRSFGSGIESPGISKDMNGILRLVGGSMDNDRFTNVWKVVYWWVEAFLSNGGYRRDFTKGDIILPSIPVYEMEAEYTEEVFEQRLSWGDLVGAANESEAMEWYEEDMHKWEEDTEHQDSDYGEVIEISDVNVAKTSFITFNPAWVGLKE
tara:strand:- start:867 stop:1952 length:1086 start_codon:yes stop_codon:yes gene_type:complete